MSALGTTGPPTGPAEIDPETRAVLDNIAVLTGK